MPFSGVLPVMPVVDGADRVAAQDVCARGRLEATISSRRVSAPSPTGTRTGSASRWASSRRSCSSPTDRRPRRTATKLRALENELQDWFDGRAPKLFYYDKTWATLVGAPASYESDAALNDHHFHYGYFVQAAAAIARYDTAWAKAWGTSSSCSRRTPPTRSRRPALPVPALHGRLRRSRLGQRALAVPRRQQRGVVVGGHELLDGRSSCGAPP